MKRNVALINFIGRFLGVFLFIFFLFHSTAYPAAASYFDTVQKIYIGYYQRPADPGGLIYWAGRLDSAGGSFAEIIEAYANSAESQALYGTINSGNISNVVNGIYNALFGRPAEPEGLNYYVNGFNLGQFTPATIMLNVLYGAQNEDLQSVNNKLTAANLFTRTIDPELDGTNFQVTYAGDGDAIAARNFLALSATSVKVPTQAETTAYIKANIADPGDGIRKISGNGTYKFSSQVFGFFPGPGIMTYLDNGTVTLDGEGGLTLSYTGQEYHLNPTTNITAMPPEIQTPVSGTYTVADDGTLSMILGSQVRTVHLSPDGNTLFGGVAEVTSTNLYNTSQTIGVKVGTGMNLASLNGSYKFSSQDIGFITGTGVANYLNNGMFTFDGQGGWTASLTGQEYHFNTSTGSITALPPDIPGPFSGTYTIANDGALTLIMGESTAFRGQVSANGNTLFGGVAEVTSTNLYNTSQTIGVKVGTGMNLASLNGSYKFSSQDIGFFTGPAIMTFLNNGTITCNGQGGFTLSYTGQEYHLNSTTNITAMPPEIQTPVSGTYTVADDGTLSYILGSQIGTMHISADGNTLFSGVAEINLDNRHTSQTIGVKMP